jgi:tetratricopeptide (TPR) repeat protein
MSAHSTVSRARVADLAFSAVSLLLLLPLQAASQQTVSLAGQVQGIGGTVIHSVINLRLESSEGVLVDHQPARTDGQFEFSSLRKERYHLTVTADGYQPHQQEVDLGFSAGTTFLNVFLTPASKEARAANAFPALTDDNASKKARKEFQKGTRALAENKTVDARGHFEKAVAEYPCYARAQTNLGISLILQHEFSRAEKALKKSIGCDPGFHEAHLVYGQLLNLQQRFAEAEKVLTQGVRLAPGSWQFYYQLGMAHFGLGRYDKAEEDYVKVQSLNPDPPSEWYVKVADLYLKMENYGKAYETMQAYLRVEPGGRFACKIRTIMEEMEAAQVVHKSQPQPASTPSPTQ